MLYAVISEDQPGTHGPRKPADDGEEKKVQQSRTENDHHSRGH